MENLMQPDSISPKVVWPAKATQVPKEIFIREDVYEEELRRIFRGPEWYPIAHSSEIPNKGDFLTRYVGDVPLLVARDQDGEPHVFYNACSHRGAQVETQTSGNKSHFQCPYHRWTFDGQGKLIRCPLNPGDSVGFSREKYPLARPRMATVHGLFFVTLSDAAPSLEVFLDGYEDKLANVMGGDGRLKLIGYHKLLLNANWKTYHDNDAWHAPLLHTAFRLLNWQGGKGRQFANDRGHRGFESSLSVPAGQTLLSDGSLIEYKGGADLSKGSCSLHLFPLFAAVKHLNTIGLRFVNPSGVDQTELNFAYFGREDDDEEMLKHRVRQSSNLLGPCGMVSMEDAAVFQRLHIGSHTPGMQIFQKGVKDEYAMPTEFSQNDESVNILSWEYYRRVMGFEKERTA
jgi:phenylpropionate dioxygenase-like ring-hydroxylating dioxygenase large terminal subunit